MTGAELIQAIQKHTDPETFQRGESYFRTGRVANRRRRGRRLAARVRGRRNYGVTLQADPGTISGYCSCPYFAGGKFCKHVSALALTWQNEPETFVDLDAIRDKIFSQDQELLADLVARIIEIYPDLVEDMGMNAQDGRQFNSKSVMKEVLNGCDPLDNTEMDLVVRRMKSVHVRAEVERDRGFPGIARRILYEMLLAALEMDGRYESADIFPRGFLAHIYSEYLRMPPADSDPLSPTPDEELQLQNHPWFEAEGLNRIQTAVKANREE